jgi:putative thiamine transport system ATP-binding protein
MNEVGMALERVAIRLGGRELLAIDAAVLPGEVLTVMGPSGSGKSALLAYIGGFLAPAFSAQGTVRIGTEDVTRLPAHLRRVGLLFQDALLFPHMSVGENLLFAIAPGERAARRATAKAALAEAGLDDFFDRDPATLSGGQKARAALMRVLVSQPRALLLDEPFSRLDADLRGQIRRFVFDEARQRNLPVLLVTHDDADAEAASGRVIKLG